VRSIRSRLLIALLGLISLVVLVLSWYVYTETAMALHDKRVATEESLESKFVALSDQTRERFDHELRRQAERLATQAVSRVEFFPFSPWQFFGVMTEYLNPYGYVSIPTWTRELYGIDPRFVSRITTKASVKFFEQGRLFEPNALEGHADEYIQIYFSNVSQRSNNLTEDCLNLTENDRQNLEASSPIYRDAGMECGKQLRFVILKSYLTKREFNRPPARPSVGRRPGNPPPRGDVGREERPIIPAPPIVVQVARETAVRDARLENLKEQYQEALVHQEKQYDQARQNLINRLALICLATIAATALGVTWLSRNSLKPLVQVADAVSNLTPSDLRLKFDSQEIKPDELPEELEPIVQRLQESLQSLEQAFAREKRATADISHELRTPLASLMTTAQVALRKTRTPEEYKTTLEQCVETGNHLTTLVERLLMLSRLDAGVDQLRQEPVDVVELAGQCVDMLRPLADQRHVEVELEVDESADNLGLVEADAGKLREILVNLIDNAVHYNKPEGHVTVRVSATSKNFTLEVIDTGMGMSSDTRGHLFERFYRADPSRQTDTVNAGLGLAIVKGYVDLFGGEIEVESELNQGSTFRVTLPRVNKSVSLLVA
jgi:heavy metal sensor kinase